MPLQKRITWSQAFIWLIAIQCCLAWSHMPLGALTSAKCCSTSRRHLWIWSLLSALMSQVAETRIRSHSYYLAIWRSKHFLTLRMAKTAQNNILGVEKTSFTGVRARLWKQSPRDKKVITDPATFCHEVQGIMENICLCFPWHEYIAENELKKMSKVLTKINTPLQMQTPKAHQHQWQCCWKILRYFLIKLAKNLKWFLLDRELWVPYKKGPASQDLNTPQLTKVVWDLTHKPFRNAEGLL